MRCSILFTSFFAGVLALPVPQVGTGLGDVMSGTAQGTNTLLSGGTNNAVNSAGASVADLSNSAGNLINRSPEAQFSGKSLGQLLAQLGRPTSSLLGRSPEAQVGTGAGDVLSGTAEGTNTLESGGANNALNSVGKSAADASNSAGDLVN